MVTISDFTIEVLRMNKASLVVRIEGENYLVTRNVFNKIASKQVSEVIVVERTYNGIPSKWLAIASIF